MKMNIELDIKYIDEDETLDDVFRDELVRQISEKVSKVVAKNDFSDLLKDEQFVLLKKEYDDEIQVLKKESHEKRKIAIENINKSFDEFILGKAYKTNSWGEVISETTIGDFVKEQILEKVKNFEKTISDIVTREVERHVKLGEYEIKKIIDTEYKKVQEENTRKAVEFIVKGVS